MRVEMNRGLAVYQVGTGEPTLVMPYPHASTSRPMGEDVLSESVTRLGRQVVTFDPPGAYRSTRPMRCDVTEMLDSAEESLTVAGVDPPVDLIGHSMGGLCALAMAVERPTIVRRLVLVGACSGFAAVRRWSVPHNWSPWRDPEWWQCLWYGFRHITGRGNLATHTRLDNLVTSASYVDSRHVQLRPLQSRDSRTPAPARSCWLKSVRRVEYRHRLHEVGAPTLLVVGRYDPQTPPVCTEELATGIPASQVALFERSGHAPFVEEPDRFVAVVDGFLGTRGSDLPTPRSSSGP